MENDGLIVRRASEQDKRNVNIYITEKGIEANEKVHSAANELKEEILSDFTEQELSEIKEFLLKLLTKMEDI